jgi:hypothetical protein
MEIARWFVLGKGGLVIQDDRAPTFPQGIVAARLPDLPLQNLRRSEKQAERPYRSAASRPSEKSQRLSPFTR